MVYRAAFAGFRHFHVLEAYRLMRASGRVRIVAACEESEPEREKLEAEHGVSFTHTSIERMLEEAPFDFLVVGDTFDRRAAITLQALEAGRHVLSDKPLCIRLDELERIEALASRRELTVGMILDLRDSGVFLRVRELVQAGDIGEVMAVSFQGQHPLLEDRRPAWYFEEGRQGGTLNDLAVHAVDLLAWITGYRVARIEAARSWNAGYPHLASPVASPAGRGSRDRGFRNAGQVMLTLENGCGVLGDVSYLAPDGFGYLLPLYWRFTFWGRKGVLEAGLNAGRIAVYPEGGGEPLSIEPAAPRTGGYLDSFLRRLEGRARPSDLSPAEVLAATREALKIQEAADRDLCRVCLPEAGPRPHQG
jgi:predicted dehydrogenase